MARKLTAKTIENLKAGPRQREISDGGSGLFLVLQTSGHKSWAVRYRFAGKPTKLTLGGWPALTLAAARKGAADALHELAQGHDPGAARKDAALTAATAKANTLAAVIAKYLKREGGKLRSLDQRVSILNRLILPVLGGRPIADIKRSEIVRLLDGIEDHNGQRMADVALAVLRRIMAWHATRSDDFVPPIVRGMSRWNAADHRRSRILDDDELRRLWAVTADGQPFSNLVRFLLLTGCRRTEAAAMRWAEITDGIWTLPASRSKTKTEVMRPLSKAAQAVIAAQPHDSDWVFTTTRVSPLKQFAAPKSKLDAVSGVCSWRLHDLRRSARSLLSRAGVNSDIAERCLGHALPAIRATYDRHRYLDEMAHAFEALATLVERIVNPPAAAKVIPIGRR
jgi:integrase